MLANLTQDLYSSFSSVKELIESIADVRLFVDWSSQSDDGSVLVPNYNAKEVLVNLQSLEPVLYLPSGLNILPQASADGNVIRITQLRFSDNLVNINEDKDVSSTVVWPSALFCVQWFRDLYQNPLKRVQLNERGKARNVRILELGCGTGLNGIAASELVCRNEKVGVHCVFTDLEQANVDLALKNFQRFESSGADSVTASGFQMDWLHFDPDMPNISALSELDLIIGTDLVYSLNDDGDYDALLNVLRSVSSKQAIPPPIVLVHQKRRSCEVWFFRKLAAHFDFRLVALDEVRGLCLYVARLKLRQELQPAAEPQSENQLGILFSLAFDVGNQEDVVVCCPIGPSDDDSIYHQKHLEDTDNYDPSNHTIITAGDAVSGSVTWIN